MRGHKGNMTCNVLLQSFQCAIIETLRSCVLKGPAYKHNTAVTTHGCDRTTHSASSPLQCYIVFMRPNDL